MKNMKKRVSAIAFTALMATALAIPSFADNDVTTSSKRHILSISRGQYLNLEGSGNAYKNRDVTIYYYSNDDDQNWYIQDIGNGLKVYTAKASSDGARYTLNVNTSTHNCNIYMDKASNNSDSVVFTEGNDEKFQVYLAGGALYGHNLSVDPSSREVMWGDVNSHYWKLS